MLENKQDFPHFLLTSIVLIVYYLTMPDRSWTAIMFNSAIVAGFIILVMTIMQSKNLNKILTEEIQQAQVDFQVYRDKSEVCFKNLEEKTNDMNTR